MASQPIRLIIACSSPRDVGYLLDTAFLRSSLLRLGEQPAHGHVGRREVVEPVAPIGGEVFHSAGERRQGWGRCRE